MSSESRPERASEPDSEQASEPQRDADGAAGGTAEVTPEPEPAREPASTPEPGPAPESGSGPASGSASGESAPAPEPAPPAYADRCYRSPGALAGGVLLLLLACWLCFDAVLGGTDRTRWIALAGMLSGVPLVIAYMLRPAVYASPQRMRVRNPFRTITVPWGAVESVQSGYSSEVVADGRKYQLWSIPVSLRARKKAARQTERAERDASRGATAPARPTGLFGLGGVPGSADDGTEKRAPSDQAIDELRALAFENSESPAAQGRVTVRWAYEIAVPALAGLAALSVLLTTR